MKIVVVGAGVVGLTTALRLLERGHAVEVHAESGGVAAADGGDGGGDIKHAPLTSDVAAALWYPLTATADGSLDMHSDDTMQRWAVETWAWLTDATRVDAPRAGVCMVPGTEVFRGDDAARDPPAWVHAVPCAFTPLDAAACRARWGDDTPFHAAWDMTLPVADMSVFMPFLREAVQARGGVLITAHVTSLDAVLARADVGAVVNCAGHGAGLLAGGADVDRVVPIRGQLAALELASCAGVRSWFIDAARVCYWIPRIPSGMLMVGGTFLAGASDMAPDAATRDAILARARAAEPRLASATVLRDVVGLRPLRKAGVRVERCGRIVHNFGHAAVGATICWGCAGDVVKLVDGMEEA